MKLRDIIPLMTSKFAVMDGFKKMRTEKEYAPYLDREVSQICMASEGCTANGFEEYIAIILV